MQVTTRLCEYVLSQSDKTEPVVRHTSPVQLQHAFREAGVSLELTNPQSGISATALKTAVLQTLQYSVRTGHPGFLNQLYARADPISIAADWVISAANTNVHTYEAAPVFTAVEVRLR